MAQQLYFWEAVYEGGTTLPEIKDGKKNNFYDIDRSKLNKFYLIGPTDVEVCMKTGRMYIGGHFFEPKEVAAHYNQDVKYELIQYKRARTVVGGESSILSYNVGWKYTKDDQHVQVIVTLCPDKCPSVELKETDLNKEESAYSTFFVEAGEVNGRKA